MRSVAVIASMTTLLLVAVGCLLWTPVPGLEEPSALAVVQNTGWPPLNVSQAPPTKPPPASGGGLQFRWDYSDLVCTGLATQPKRTGTVERVNDADRDQLSVSVELQTCFKGVQPAGKVTVLGDSAFSRNETRVGMVYAGPPTGFVSQGRNLLFLRGTDSPHTWRVTLPIYATCLPLADVAPDYKLDGSESAIRRALGKEIEAAIFQGRVASDHSLGLQALQQPEFVAAVYGPYILEVFGKPDGLIELARIMPLLPQSARRTIAMELLRNGDQRGLADTLALLQDESAVSWQRANAALALEYAASPQARIALEALSEWATGEDLRSTAREVLARIDRNHS